jgi:DNA polymerase-1
VIFDASEQTFRNEIDPNYKANRPPAPDDLVPQFGMIREATRAFGVACLELGGYEADDLIAAYACRAKEAGASVVIVSSDKDLMQLVNEHVVMLDPVKQVTIGREQVIEKFGVPPEKVIDVQALIGDTVDNVPGAPGIGVKTASLLINEFGDLETLLERAGEIKQRSAPDADRIRRPDPAEPPAGDARLRHAHPAPLEDLVVRDPDGPTLHAFLEKMEFRTLSRRITEGRPTQAPVTPWIEPEARPIAEPCAIDPRIYACVRDLPALDEWIARRRFAEPCASTPRRRHRRAPARLVGVSLSLGPGDCAFVPLLNTDAGLDFGSTVEAITCARD